MPGYIGVQLIGATVAALLLHGIIKVSATNGARPLTGAVLAVTLAYALRGPGGGHAGSGAAQGDLYTDVKQPDRT